MSFPYLTTTLPYNQEIAVQQNLLNKAFEMGNQAELGYHSMSKKVLFPPNSGNTLTYTKKGLFGAVTSPLNPANLNTLDNGLTATNFLDEQYTIRIDTYAQAADLNIFVNAFGIADVGIENAYNLGESSRRSIDLYNRDTMLNAYMGGNTRVTATLGAPALTINVDDIRGFEFVIPTSGASGGTQVAVSPTNPMPVLVGSTVYTLTAATPDVTNVSTVVLIGGTALGQGISGTLTFTTNVSIADATSGNLVKGSFSPLIVRPNGKLTTADLAGSDTFKLEQIRRMSTYLNNQGTKRMPNGNYMLIMSPDSFEQLYADTEFQLLYRGTMFKSDAYGNFYLNSSTLGCDIIVTQLAPIQTLGLLTIQRPIMVGRDALIQARAEAMEVFADAQYRTDTYRLSMVGDIMMVTRNPIDRLKMLISQAWFFAGGWTATTDQTTNPTTVPTSNYAYYKRAVVCEHAGLI